MFGDEKSYLRISAIILNVTADATASSVESKPLPPPSTEDINKNLKELDMLNEIEKQFWALGQDQYEIVKMRREPGTVNNFYQTDTRTLDDMRRKIDKYSMDVQQGENLYIRALPDDIHEVIFLDDMSEEAVDFLSRKKGMIPCCIVETSEKNGKPSLHCWYRLDEPTDRPTRKAIEYHLISMLHENFPDPDPKKMPGDFGSNDGCHLGRLAGSWNYGLTSRKNNPIMLVEASGHILSYYVTQDLLEKSEKYRDINRKKIDIELEKIISHEYDNEKIVQWYRENAIPKMISTRPHFEQDFDSVCRLLKAKPNFSDLDIMKVLWENDPNPIQERKQSHEAHYLALTVYKAKKHLGIATEEVPSPTPTSKKKEGGGSALLSASADAPASAIDIANVPKSGTQTYPEKPKISEQLQQAVENYNEQKKQSASSTQRKSFSYKVTKIQATNILSAPPKLK